MFISRRKKTKKTTRLHKDIPVSFLHTFDLGFHCSPFIDCIFILACFYSSICLVVVVDLRGLSVMEPYLFPECLICQVHAFGYPLRRGSLFYVCLAIPVTAAIPSLLCTLTYSCPTGCSETDTQELQREAGHSLSSLRFNSQAAVAADGLWRLNHQAHGSYCALLIVKFKGHL